LIVDTSAIVAVVLAEEHAPTLIARLDEADDVGVGAPALLEAGMVLTSRSTDGAALVRRFLTDADAVVIAFGAFHWPAAVDAFRRYGKGRHPAALNLGDCLTYAIAKLAQQPLLCLGDDFAQTDLDVVAL